MAEPRRQPGLVRVLFVNDHLGYSHGVTHGGTTYLTHTLGNLPRVGVLPSLCILRGFHPAAERLRAVGVDPVFLGRAKWDPRALPDLLALLRRDKPDIVHLNGMKAHLIGRLAARAAGIPAIVHLHFEYAPVLGPLQRALGRRTPRLLAASERLAEHGRNAFGVPGDRSEAVYNGLPDEAFAVAPDARRTIREWLAIPADAPVIAVVGRLMLRPDKGHRELLRALALVQRRLPDVVLVIAGDGPARSACEHLTDELGLRQNVRFVGQIERVADVLAASDVAAMPSMCEEAFGYAALEAEAVGRPVVAFRVGGLPEAVVDGRTGILVERGDVEALGHALEELLVDGARRSSMGVAARAFASEFTIERHVQRLGEIYRELLGVTS